MGRKAICQPIWNYFSSIPLDRLALKLAHIQVVIEALFVQELLVAALFHNFPPWAITTTLSASRMVLNGEQWTKLVRPFISCSRAFWMRTSVRVSTLLVASSKIKIAGFARMARTMARAGAALAEVIRPLP